MNENISTDRIYYNLFEANAMVPRLEYLFTELARIQQRVNRIVERAERSGIQLDVDAVMEGAKCDHPGGMRLQKLLLQLGEEYASHVDILEEMGIVVEDIESGIVNFYSLLDGEEVLLSWEYGEPEVGYWHDLDEDYQCRRSLRKLLTRSPRRPRLH